MTPPKIVVVGTTEPTLKNKKSSGVVVDVVTNIPVP
jgi:hypothetical protein